MSGINTGSTRLNVRRVLCLSSNSQCEWTFLQMFEIKVWITGCYSTCSHRVRPACSVLFMEIFDAIGHLSLSLLHVWGLSLCFQFSCKKKKKALALKILNVDYFHICTVNWLYGTVGLCNKRGYWKEESMLYGGDSRRESTLHSWRLR